MDFDLLTLNQFPNGFLHKTREESRKIGGSTLQTS